MMRAGFPTTSACGGTSATTTAPAPTMHARPSVTPQTIVALAPMLACSSTTVGTTVQSVPEDARGTRSFVKVAFGPTNTSSAMVTPWYTDTPFWILQRAPTD